MADIKKVEEMAKLVQSFDFSKLDFKIDELQKQMVLRYIQEDINFRRAFNTDYTTLFLKYMFDKIQLREPISIAIIGAVRSSKSTIGITIAGLIKCQQGLKLEKKNVCPNEYNFVEEIKKGAEKKALKNDVFVIDESKQAVFGVGSIAKKMKLTDIQNIIAVNNISTIWIRPDRWSFEGVDYGLRTFGRCFDSNPRFSRLMLYNLTARGSSGELPMGMVYLPHYEDVFSEGKNIDKWYREKKQEWVDREQRGEGDVTAKTKMQMAKRFSKNKNFIKMNNKEKTAFIYSTLGSELTRSEAEEIMVLSNMILKGLIKNARGNK